MTKFTYEYTVRGTDIDINYKITPGALCSYFQESFARYCTQKNVAAFDIIKRNVLWVIADMRANFSPFSAFWGEKVKTQIWCSEIKQLRLYADFRIFSGSRVIAEGDSCFFIIDKDTRKPHKISDIVKNFREDNEFVFGEHKRVMFDKFNNMVSQRNYVVDMADLDFNYHVNNLTYMKKALLHLDSEYLKNHYLKHYEVAFMKESFLKDEWSCELYENNNEFYHKFIRKSDGEELCVIKSFWEYKIPDTNDICCADFNMEKSERNTICTF